MYNDITKDSIENHTEKKNRVKDRNVYREK